MLLIKVQSHETAVVSVWKNHEEISADALYSVLLSESKGSNKSLLLKKEQRQALRMKIPKRQYVIENVRVVTTKLCDHNSHCDQFVLSVHTGKGLYWYFVYQKMLSFMHVFLLSFYN